MPIFLCIRVSGQDIEVKIAFLGQLVLTEVLYDTAAVDVVESGHFPEEKAENTFNLRPTVTAWIWKSACVHDVF